MKRVTIEYGDRRYGIELSGLHETHEYEIMSNIYQALREFHGDERDVYNENYRLKGALNALASEYPVFRERISSILGGGVT
jgi:hypothetical protein